MATCSLGHDDPTFRIVSIFVNRACVVPLSLLFEFNSGGFYWHVVLCFRR